MRNSACKLYVCRMLKVITKKHFFSFLIALCPNFTVQNGLVLIPSQGIYAAIFCDTGFSLFGYSPLYCQTNGTWDNPAPSCGTCIFCIWHIPLS